MRKDQEQEQNLDFRHSSNSNRKAFINLILDFRYTFFSSLHILDPVENTEVIEVVTRGR